MSDSTKFVWSPAEMDQHKMEIENEIQRLSGSISSHPATTDEKSEQTEDVFDKERVFQYSEINTCLFE